MVLTALALKLHALLFLHFACRGVTVPLLADAILSAVKTYVLSVAIYPSKASVFNISIRSA